MEALQIRTEHLQFPNNLMNSLPSKFRSKLYSSIFKSNFLCTSSLASGQTEIRTPQKTVSRVRVTASAAQLKEGWLSSLSCPLPLTSCPCCGGDSSLSRENLGPSWAIGIDPDLSGALAILKSDESGCSAQVFDSPYLQVLVGKRVRKRLDAKSIIQLLRTSEVPVGTTAYLEQSIPFPQDGKQGWWSGGFGYGLWIGILVASGFSVVPVPSITWKNEFELCGSRSSKDDSRRVASMLFPSLSPLLKRKKDHGRAEALLIAAYGKGLKMKTHSPCSFNDSIVTLPFDGLDVEVVNEETSA